MTETQTQQYSFQAEIKQLLHLLSHSLYQNREITIRELVSNASDALDKFRYQSVTTGQGTAAGLGIWLEPDKDAKILVIRDNGIGMTQQELIQNLGTIARSGSLEFLKQARNRSTDGNPDLSLIGQFGVGFYSAFMLADRVEVVSLHQHPSAPEGRHGGIYRACAAEVYRPQVLDLRTPRHSPRRRTRQRPATHLAGTQKQRQRRTIPELLRVSDALSRPETDLAPAPVSRFTVPVPQYSLLPGRQP